jgi:hypothetical protein
MRFFDPDSDTDSDPDKNLKVRTKEVFHKKRKALGAFKTPPV